MSRELPNYDAWREGAFMRNPPAGSPYAKEPPECSECGETLTDDNDGGWYCEGCGYAEPEYEPDYDDLRERQEEARAERFNDPYAW